MNVLNSVEQVVFEHAQGRPIMFSSFQPDAALLIRKLQSTYPVRFNLSSAVASCLWNNLIIYI